MFSIISTGLVESCIHVNNSDILYVHGKTIVEIEENVQISGSQTFLRQGHVFVLLVTEYIYIVVLLYIAGPTSFTIAK